MSVTVRLDMKGIERIQRELLPKAQALIDKTAFEVQGRAQNMAPVKTSALKNSIYTVTRRSNGFAQAQLETTLANPNVTISPLPVPSEDLEANVGPSVEYAIYQELGTVNMPAHPYLIPALEQMRPSWNAAWKALFRSMV